ncbi:MAG: RNA polymerase sigma factor [Acutalibacteraceae bacterium]
MITPAQSRQAFEQLVDEYSDMIYRIAYQNLRSSYDAEDIMQDVFLSLLKSNVGFSDSAHIKAWLIKVTVNKCIDFKKSARYRTTVTLDEQTARYDSEELGVMDEIFKLPEEERNIIYLYYYEGYTIAEIAQILGKKQNTVNSKLQRARKKLQSLLKKGGYYYERHLQKSAE